MKGWSAGFQSGLTLPDSEFRNLTRSTIALVSFWIDMDRALHDLSKAAGDCDLSESNVEFEAETESFGHAEASHTDVLVTVPGLRIAVEAKWTEPQYETVGKWKTRVRNPGPVIEHWLARLKPFCDPPGAEGLESVTYQMLHRCASACDPRHDRAALLYQIFTDSKHAADEYVTNLRRFVEVVRPKDRLRVGLLETPLKTTQAYAAAEEALASARKRDDSLRPSSVIRRAVARGDLFVFSESVITIF